MMGAFAFGSFAFINCATCGIEFGITQDFQSRRREDHAAFFCPSGHENVYRGENEKERLKKENENLKRRLEWKEQDLKDEKKYSKSLDMKARAFKGVATKIKKRVGNGVCPCCNRTFQNLMNHMKSQHPSFKDSKK